MQKKQRFVAVAALVAVLALGLAFGIGHNAGASATGTSFPPARVINLTKNTDLPLAGGTYSTILALGTGPGNYLISATGDLVNFNTEDYLRCRLLVAGSPLSSVAAYAGSSINVVGGFALSGGVTLHLHSTIIDLSCAHDATVGSGPPYVDSGATLTIDPVLSLVRTSHS
jgi:hypothetical protein